MIISSLKTYVPNHTPNTVTYLTKSICRFHILIIAIMVSMKSLRSWLMLASRITLWIVSTQYSSSDLMGGWVKKGTNCAILCRESETFTSTNKLNKCQMLLPILYWGKNWRSKNFKITKIQALKWQKRQYCWIASELSNVGNKLNVWNFWLFFREIWLMKK